MTPEMEALSLLKALGIDDIRIRARVGDRILYTHANGDPVLDAPVARVVDGKVRLEAWSQQD